MLEACGILVPPRYENLKEVLKAIEEGKEIVVRSEHPEEYASVAGLLESYTLNGPRIAESKAFCSKNGTKINWNNYYKDYGIREVKVGAEKRIFGRLKNTDDATFRDRLIRLSLPKIRIYCNLLGLDIEKFIERISYSYWGKIRGYNRSIIADSTIPGRYHIFTSGENFKNYCIIDNGKVVLNGPNPMTDELREGLEGVIEFYERIRTECRGSASCPLVEFQTDRGQNYFLQYRITRNMEPCSWQLERELKEGEFEADFVRGATSPEGMILNVAMYYPNNIEALKKVVEKGEEGSFDFLTPSILSGIFPEIMSRRRIACFFTMPLEGLMESCFDAHLPKSRLFNPQISISFRVDNLPPPLYLRLYEKTKTSGQPSTIRTFIVSDGRKAYIKFLDTH